jgi:glutaredoxin
MMYVMVSRRNCPFCDKAKQLINSKGGSVSHYSLEESKWILDLFKKADLKTVPQI